MTLMAACCFSYVPYIDFLEDLGGKIVNFGIFSFGTLLALGVFPVPKKRLHRTLWILSLLTDPLSRRQLCVTRESVPCLLIHIAPGTLLGLSLEDQTHRIRQIWHRPCLSCQPAYSPVPHAQVTGAFSRGWGGCKWWCFPSEQRAMEGMDLGAPEGWSEGLAPAVHCMTQGWLQCSSSSSGYVPAQGCTSREDYIPVRLPERGGTHLSVKKSDKSVSNKVKGRQGINRDSSVFC